MSQPPAVTGDLNSPSGLQRNSINISELELVSCDVLISNNDIHYTVYSCNDKSIFAAGTKSSVNAQVWRSNEIEKALAEIREIIGKDSKIHLEWTGIPFSLIPQSFESGEASLHDLLQVNYELQGEAVQSVKALKGDLTIVYAFNEAVRDAINQMEPAATFDLQIRKQLIQAEKYSKTKNKSVVFLYQGADFMHLIAYSTNRGLELVNIYDTGSAEDSLYFLTHVFDSLGFDASNDHVVLSGLLGDGQLLKKILSPYFTELHLHNSIPEMNSQGFPIEFISSVVKYSPCE